MTYTNRIKDLKEPGRPLWVPYVGALPPMPSKPFLYGLLREVNASLGQGPL